MSTAKTAPRKRVDAATRRQLILDAAARLFLHRPYPEVTTRALADAAGVSEALLFQHFGTKRDLYAAVVRQAVGDVTRQLTEVFVAAAELPEVTVERLEELFRGALAFWFDQPEVVWSFLTEADAAEARRAYYQVLLDQEAAILPALERSRAEGLLPDVDPRVLLRALLGQPMIFLVTEKLLSGEELAPINKDAIAVDLARLWSGLLGVNDRRRRSRRPAGSAAAPRRPTARR